MALSGKNLNKQGNKIIMQFNSVDHALRFAYKTKAKLIIQQSSVWKGERILGHTELNLHDLHAQSSLIIKIVEECLNSQQLAVIRCHYTCDYAEGHIELAKYFACGDDILMIDDLLENIFCKRPKLATMKYEYKIAQRTLERKKKILVEKINDWFTQSMCQLEHNFYNKGILNQNVA